MKYFQFFQQQPRFSRASALALMLGLFLFGANACKKDWVNSATDNASQPTEQRNGNSVSISDYGVPVTGISVTNGMLNFVSLPQVNLVLGMLDSLSADSTTNLAILNALGYEGYESPGAPAQPVLFLFDQYFNFPSLRQKLENLKTLERQTGADFSVEKNRMPFWEPGLGSIVNETGELKVGQLIYKYLDDNRTVVFRAGDPVLLSLVRTTPDPFTIQNQFNFFKIDSRKKDDLALYDRVETASTFGDCLFDIKWSNVGNQFYFHSSGYFPPSGNVVWRIIDGNGNVIATQNGSTIFNYLIPAGVTYPLTVSIKSIGCAPYDVLFSESPQNNNYNCNTFDFTYEYDASNPLKLYFTIPPFTPLINWNFDDGVIFATPATGASPVVFSHTYTQDGSYTVCATVQPANCSKTVCKELGDVNCGEFGNFKRSVQMRFGALLNRRATMEMGLKDPLIGKSRVHASLASEKADANGNWALSPANKIELDWHSTPGALQLRYYIPNCETKDEMAFIAEFNKSKIEGLRKINKKSKMKKVDARVDFLMFFPETTFSVSMHY